MSRYDVGLDRKANDPLNIMLDHIQPNSVILEFGCANGRMTKYMHEQLNCTVYIVEYNKDDYKEAIQYAERGVCGDIMQMEWLRDFQGVKFDYIIFADVLEHLNDPEKIVKAAASILQEDGTLWISVPNIAHNDIILKLLKNRFDYTKTGLLDDTHIHFFTYRSLIDMCERVDLKPIYKDCTSVQTGTTEQSFSQELEDDDFLELLESRVDGEIYQCVIEFAKRESSKYKNAVLVDNIIQKIPVIERRVFFDFGDGFSVKNYIVTRHLRTETYFSEKIEIPEGVKRVRFDPVEQFPCVIKNLHVFSDDSRELAIETNGTYEKAWVFRTYDPQIIVSVDNGIKTICFEGEIHYTFDIMPAKEGSYRKLKEERDEIQANFNEITAEMKEKCESAEKIFEYNKRLEESIQKLEKTNIEYKQEKLKFIYKQELYKDKIKRQNISIKAMEKDLNSRMIEMESLKKQIEITSTRLQQIENSTSWKCTAFIRKLLDNVKSTNDLNENLSAPVTGDDQEEKKLQSIENKQISSELLWDYDALIEEDKNPLVSIIVPNYNHAPYLRERLESIYNQTYKNFEVILLDDCSSDKSRDILDAYAEAYADNTKKVYNTENCGKVFRQWDRGIALAKGKLIWIAESDDYCELDFLEKMVPLFEKESVMLAFARSVFMQDGEKVWSTEEYLSDLPRLSWEAPFTMTAHNLVNEGFAIKNVIPNVSSAVFKNIGKISEQSEPLWEKMKLCGDWIFYLNLIRGGCVSYTNETTNYYRVHAQSTSLNIQKTDDYYREQCEVSKYVVKNYDVNIKAFETVLHNLKEHYKAIRHTSEADCVEKYYKISEIEDEVEKRKPNVLMCIYSMSLGGGETYALHLANEMKRQGIAVTLLDFRMGEYHTEIKRLLSPNVPCVEIKNLDYLYQVITQLDGEIIHSHHACVDEAVSDWIMDTPLRDKCHQVITLHGMYETINKEDCLRVVSKVTRSCNKFIYIADKNLNPFIDCNLFDRDSFIKLDNGLPEVEINPVDRSQWNIGSDDFVVCLASRGIPEKGWYEAIEAVNRVNSTRANKIHLMILGDGVMRGKLEKYAPDYIHFTGLVSNVRDYFAMSDIGLLPSWFQGESYPLVIIECFQARKPMIATNIGEVKNQLMDENGELAGILIPLNNGILDIQDLADAIELAATDTAYYQSIKERVASAKKKFNIEKIAGYYVDVYREVREVEGK